LQIQNYNAKHIDAANLTSDSLHDMTMVAQRCPKK